MYLLLLIVEIVILYLLAKSLHLGIARLFYKLTKSEKRTGYLVALLFLPGTLLHELSHFMFALFLLVPVGTIELMPELMREGDKVGMKLGSVPIGKSDPLRRFLIGVAPLIVGTMALIAVVHFIAGGSLPWWRYLLAGYLVFEIANTMFLSKRDLEGAWVVIVLAIMIAVLALILGVRVSYSDFTVLQTSVFYLGVAVGIDIAVVSVFKFVKLI